MPATPAPRFVDLLRRLAGGDVEFVVVGMLSGVLQGAPVATYDVDLVHRRTPENVDRLLRVLTDLDAVYRHDARRLRPGASHLLGPGHQLLSTSLGDLDCLGTIDAGLGYDELLPDTVELELGEGLHCRALALARLVEVKRRAGRPKDLAALPTLIATLDEVTRRGRP